MNIDDVIAPYGRAIVKLLKGPVEYDDTNTWETVLNYQTEIQKYLSQIGMELIVKRDDGFAYLRQMEDDEGRTIGMTSRQPLGFEVSVILIILRQMLEEFDNDVNNIYTHEKFVNLEELKGRIELFLPERFNRVKLMNELDNYIKRIVDLGFLKAINRDNTTIYQIHRIIKEKVTLNQLQDFKNKLENYVESV